jgi:membrane protein YdbS with pleckstrin-like domain
MSAVVHLPSKLIAENDTHPGFGVAVSVRFATASVASSEGVDMVDPAHLPSRRAPLRWAVGGVIPWLLLAVGQVVWFEFDRRMPWLHALIGVATVLGVVVSTAVVPVWRYRVHRWELGPQAVFTRTGWLVQERRIAPISRVQTVDTYRDPIDRLFGLANVTVTTASSAGAVRIVALDVDVADHLVAQLTDIAAIGAEDAT